MTILEAHGRLANWSPEQRAETLPGEFYLDLPAPIKADAWPACAVGAVVCSGWLPNLDTDDDLKEALQQFGLLMDAEILTAERWREETAGLLATLAAWGEEHDRLAGCST